MKRTIQGPFRFLTVVAAVALSIGIVTTAEAAIIGTTTLVRNPPGLPFTSPDAALGAPWMSFLLGVHANAGEIIAAVDVSISGPLHQRWTFDEDTGIFVQTPNSANQSNGDSHLRAVSGAIFGAGPTEDNLGTGSPLPSTAAAHYGVGTSLSGAWGIPLASQAQSANLAYIVVPSNRTHEISIRVKVANPQGDIIADLGGPCSFFACVDGPQIAVYGQGIEITDGDNSPSSADGTDLGGRNLFDPPLQRTFTITNPGFSRLNLQPPVLSGPYSLVGDFPAFVNDGQAASFTVALNLPLTPGVYPGSIAFGHDVGAGGTFNFDLSARVVPEPASLVLVLLAAIGGCGPVRRRF